MSTYNKKISIGNISLAESYFEYIHTLPLVTFRDAKSKVELALVFNSQISNQNHFNIYNGYKFNLQKKIITSVTSVLLLDSNGCLIPCNHATNETAQTATTYALNDNSHRILRKLSDGYELEYPDYSKEIFDLSGKITKLYDKHGEEILRYGYDANNRLASISYRPSVSTNYKVLNVNYNSSNQISSIVYNARKGTGVNVLSVCSFTFASNGFNIQHCSGAKYYLSKVQDIYTAYSTITKNSIETEIEKQICTKSNNKYTVETFAYGELKDTISYESVFIGNDNEIEILDITDFNGAKTRIQYRNHMPCYHYEIADNMESMFNAEGEYLGNVHVQEAGKFNGTITRVSGYKTRDESSTYSRHWSLDFGSNTSSDEYTGSAVVVGWLRWDFPVETEFNVNNNYFYKVKIEKPDTWQFFCLPIYNSQREINIWGENVGYPVARDVRVMFLKTEPFLDKELICNPNSDYEYNLNEVSFKNVLNVSTTISDMKATSADVLHYQINLKKNVHINEFSYNDGRSIITNAGTIYSVMGSNNAVLNNDSVLTKIYKKGLDTLYEEYILNESAFLHINEHCSYSTYYKRTRKYNTKIDLIVESINTSNLPENEIVKTTMYTDDGLVDGVYLDDMRRIYRYDDDTYGTKLVLVSDEHNNTTTFETDDVWGVITKVVVNDNVVYQNSYTDDGIDPTSYIFGTFSSLGVENKIFYEDGNVSKMQSNGIQYGFNYNQGDLVGITKNGNELKNISYSDDYKTISVASPTSTSASYTKTTVTDDYGRELSVSGCRQNEYAFNPQFDENGVHMNLGDGKGSNTLSTTKDLVTNDITQFGNIVNENKRKIVTKSGNTIKSSTIIEYDKSGRAISTEFNADSNKYNDQIQYNTVAQLWETGNNVYKHKYLINDNLIVQTVNEFDKFQRIKEKKHTINGLDFEQHLWYYNGRVDGITYRVGSNTVASQYFTYDALGRVVEEDGLTSDFRKSYEYDSVGRLVRENNEVLNKTYTYQYDSAGNVTGRKTYAYTTDNLPASATTTDTMVYSTTYPDRLTSYNGNAVTYDQQGCPLTYEDKTFTWSKGKMTMIAYDVNSGIGARAIVVPGIIPSLITKRWDYTYNGNGQRTQKKYTYIPANNEIVAQVATSEIVNYTYDHSGRLIHEQTSRTLNSGETSSSSIAYLYDCNTIIGMVHNGATYYFERNIQGDVVGVYDSTGTKVVTFKYDAFGRCTVSGNSTLAQWCKIRYRGYYYDTETGLYWVQTRYYNPDWCRWISPDSISYLDPQSPLGLNLYLYCGNDPINYVDPSGHSLVAILSAVILGFAAIAGATLGGVTAYNRAIERDETGSTLAWSTIKGVFLGGAIGLAAGGLILSAVSMAGVVLSWQLGLTLATVNSLYVAAAVGLVTFNIVGATVLPLLGEQTEMLEWGNAPYLPNGIMKSQNLDKGGAKGGYFSRTIFQRNSVYL